LRACGKASNPWLPWLAAAQQNNARCLGLHLQGAVVDGVNQWPALTQDASAPRTQFVYNIDPCPGGKQANMSAIRVGDWKYILADRMPDDVWMPAAWVPPSTPSILPPASVATGPFLFNIRLDPEERTNLATTNPAKAKELADALAAAAAEGSVTLFFSPLSKEGRGGQFFILPVRKCHMHCLIL